MSTDAIFKYLKVLKKLQIGILKKLKMKNFKRWFESVPMEYTVSFKTLENTLKKNLGEGTAEILRPKNKIIYSKI